MITHLQAELPPLLASKGVSVARVAELRDVVDCLIALDLERLRPSLEAALPRRPGGRPPHDQVVMLRSVFLAVVLMKGRLNAWGKALAADPILPVLIGLPAGARPPSIGAHYAFLRRNLAAASGAGDVELATGHGGRFERSIPDERPREDASAGACETMRALLKRPLPPSLDERLMGWIVAVGVKALSEATGLPKRFDLHIDGTVHQSHASHRAPRACTAPEPKPAEAPPAPEPQPAEAQPPPAPKRRRRKRGGARPHVVPPATLPEPIEVPTRRKRKSPANRKPAPPQQPRRVYADPKATWRYSTASDGVEFGHLGLAATTRLGNVDVPLFSAFARPHVGETPESMRAISLFQREMARQLPQYSIRSLVGDSGYDAAAFYAFAHDMGADPIIGLGANPLPTPEGDFDPEGRPLCVAGASMLLHSRQGRALVYKCPAMHVKRQSGDSNAYTFKPEDCPLGKRCSDKPSGPYRRVHPLDHPRLHLPVPRGSAEFKERYDARSTVERHFAHQHAAIPDRRYRRLHLWQFACAMHCLWRQATVVTRLTRGRNDTFWDELLKPPEQSAA